MPSGYSFTRPTPLVLRHSDSYLWLQVPTDSQFDLSKSVWRGANAQRLANGNTLICESVSKRVFEVTPAGETVWEYVAARGSPRAYRYPYDHCPQTAALGCPSEVPVTPPEELRIEPDPVKRASDPQGLPDRSL